jgi:hypothetical protein
VYKTFIVVGLVGAIVVGGGAVAYSQGILLDFAADTMVQKYQSSSCDQLKAMRRAGPSLKEKATLAYLHNDDQARISFINKIAAPVANRMFVCGMFP